MEAITPNKKFLLTNDADWIPGSAPGLEALLELCEEYRVPSTIFVAGHFANSYARLIGESREVRSRDRGSRLGAYPGYERKLLLHTLRKTEGVAP